MCKCWNNLEVQIVLIHILQFLTGGSDCNIIQNNITVVPSKHRIWHLVWILIIIIIFLFLFVLIIVIILNSTQKRHRCFSRGSWVCSSSREVNNVSKVVTNKFRSNMFFFRSSTFSSLPSSGSNPTSTSFENLTSDRDILRSQEN